jgi:hypothetical protein
MAWHYRLFDLDIASDLELPGIPTGAGTVTHDLMIHHGDLPDAFPTDEGDYAVEGGFLMVLDGAGRYLVTGGSAIRVEPEPGADAANVRLFLLGSAMGALLYQRGLVPLHANAIAVDGRAIAFAGPSGSGKSTLAAWCHDHGYAVLADDVAALDCRDGGVVLLPGLPRVRLWRGALEASGRDTRDHPPSFVGETAYDKFDVALDRVAGEALPVSAIYLLERGERSELLPLTGMSAVEALVANSYRGEFVGSLGMTAAHVRHCLAIARRVPVFRAIRPWGSERLDEANGELMTDIRGGVRAGLDPLD